MHRDWNRPAALGHDVVTAVNALDLPPCGLEPRNGFLARHAVNDRSKTIYLAIDIQRSSPDLALSSNRSCSIKVSLRDLVTESPDVRNVSAPDGRREMPVGAAVDPRRGQVDRERFDNASPCRNLPVATDGSMSRFIKPERRRVRPCARRVDVVAGPGMHPAVLRPEAIE